MYTKNIMIANYCTEELITLQSMGKLISINNETIKFYQKYRD